MTSMHVSIVFGLALGGALGGSLGCKKEQPPPPPEPAAQPAARLGYLWRGLDNVRNRLGSGLAPEQRYDGFRQTAPSRNPDFAGREDIFLSASDGTVIQLLPAASEWQILTPSLASPPTP